jgi:2-C-methyl-D-erythritol 4-phosphate cytidylyltransferase/2-C-methyl-D-erythritol 2,4-cyclodiphosphate synthase
LTIPERPSADVIVVAAGTSRRFGRDKLDVPVGGRPLVAWTLERVAAAPEVDRIVLVTSAERVDALRAATWLSTSVAAVVAGGERRHESVAAGLAALDELGPPDGGDRIVLVHDAARPNVSSELIRAVVEAATRSGAAIPVVPIAETVKRVATDAAVLETVDRADLALAQTPQAVRRGLLREAFRRYPPDGPETWTDEAALLEACRIAVHAIPGDPSNIKVTLPADIERLTTGSFAPQGRIGFGRDSHPFGPGGPLMLGGRAIDGAPALHGHSDGDVVLHATMNGLLGAAGLGDLGRLYPADERTPAGTASAALLAGVLDRLRTAGARPRTVDVTIVGARPRLGDQLDAIRDRLASLLGLASDAVSVKASTGNLQGMEGAGRGISAEALVTIDVADGPRA